MTETRAKSVVALFISSRDPGGAESMVVDLADRLAARGVDVEIWHFGNEWLQRAADERGLRTAVLEDRYFRKSYWILHFSIYLSRFAARRGIRVIHSHLYGAIVGAALAAWWSGLTHVGTLHDRYSLFERRGRIGILRLAEMLGTKLVAVSKAIRRDLIASGGAWRALSTIHNGINLAVYRPCTERPNETSMTVVCVARLIPLKRIDLLIRAVADLPARIGVRLLVAGEGPERGALANLIDQVDKFRRVELLGFRTDVAELLSSADCYALVSDTEGLSFSILESMAAGIPAVVTDVGGNKELVLDGETGRIIDAGDLPALRRTLEEIADDPHWRRAAGERARRRAEQLFSSEAMTDAYVALYGQPPVRPS